MLIRKSILASLVAVLAMGVSAPVFAQDGESSSSGETKTVEQKSEDTVVTTDTTTEESTETKSLSDRLRLQKSQIEERKAELKAEMEKKTEERKQKLEGHRLAQCQNREDNINNLMGKSASVGKQRLARIQAFEEGVKAFYVKQDLSSDQYDAAVQAADDNEAAAIAAIDVYAEQKYDCTTVSGEDTSGTIRDAHDTAKTALKAYRDSVKDLLKIVKAAFEATKTETDSTGEGA